MVLNLLCKASPYCLGAMLSGAFSIRICFGVKMIIGATIENMPIPIDGLSGIPEAWVTA
jgi:hypothetical protein